MSIKSTHIVTREFALQAIQLKLYGASDNQLADILEDVLHNGFYNFRIVSQEEFQENKNKKYPMPLLDDLSNLPEYNDAW